MVLNSVHHFALSDGGGGSATSTSSRSDTDCDFGGPTVAARRFIFRRRVGAEEEEFGEELRMSWEREWVRFKREALLLLLLELKLKLVLRKRFEATGE